MSKSKKRSRTKAGRTALKAPLPPQASHTKGLYHRLSQLAVPFGIAATALSFWAVWLQAVPSVQPPPPSDSFDNMTFTVTNPSPFLNMRALVMTCNVDADVLFPEDAKTHNLKAKVETNPTDIAASGQDSIGCTEPFSHKDGHIIEITQSATLSLTFYYKLLWVINRTETPASFIRFISLSGKRYWAPVPIKTTK